MVRLLVPTCDPLLNSYSSYWPNHPVRKKSYFPASLYSPWKYCISISVKTGNPTEHGVKTRNSGWKGQFHRGRIRSHPRISYVSIHVQPRQSGDENYGHPVRQRSLECGNNNLLFVDPSTFGEDNIPTPDHKYLHKFTTPTNQRPKRWSPGSIPPLTVWKSQPHWVLTKPQPGVRSASATQGVKYVIPGSEILPCFYNSSKPGMKAVVPRVDTVEHGVESLNWGLYGELQPGRIRSHLRVMSISIHLYTSDKAVTKTIIPRVDSSPQGVENTTWGS